MKIGLYFSKTEDLEIVKKIISILKKFKVEVYMLKFPEKTNLELKQVNDIKILDFIVIIGGDGTVLRYIHEDFINDEILSKIPILHIGTGRVNFFSDSTLNDFENSITKLIMKSFTVDERSLLYVCSSHNTCIVLNEVLIRTTNFGRVSNFTVIEIDSNEIILNGRMDGVIIATPTGSTAYSLSVNGPVIDLRVNAKVITPLAPFSKAFVPIVHPINVPIKVICEDNSYIICDGVRIWIDKEITIKEHYVKLKFIRTKPHNFYTRLSKRLFTP